MYIYNNGHTIMYFKATKSATVNGLNLWHIKNNALNIAAATKSEHNQVALQEKGITIILFDQKK